MSNHYYKFLIMQEAMVQFPHAFICLFFSSTFFTSTCLQDCHKASVQDYAVLWLVYNSHDTLLLMLSLKECDDGGYFTNGLIIVNISLSGWHLACGAGELSSYPISPVMLASPSLPRRRLLNEMYNVMDALHGCHADKFDSCNNLLSSIHNISVIVLLSVSL